MIRLVTILFLLICELGFGQEIDADLLRIKARMDAVQRFSAIVVLDLDVPFIRMPTKTAKIHYEKGKQTTFSSQDFVMLPKRGLDFSLTELFKYPFITVERGVEVHNGKSLKLINVIPTDNRSELALATLFMDVKKQRIAQSEINTRKEGSYTLQMEYAAEKDVLPSYLEATFAVERLKIPFNFMGKDTQIDRKKMKNTTIKSGKIKMQLKDYHIEFNE